MSTYLVADAWFSKKKFVDQIVECGMHMVGRLRDDADLLYLYQGQPTGKQGRPKKYAGKIDHHNIDMNYFGLSHKDQDLSIYSAVVYSKSLKRNIRLVHVVYGRKNENPVYKLYFSTDTKQEPLEIVKYYRSRFQIEFIYRDAKQQ